MTARKRLLQNRAARWVVTVGGLAIIASILGIMVFISVEVLPLLGGAEVEVHSSVDLDGHLEVGSIIADEYRERALILAPDLTLTALNLVNGTSERDPMPAPVAAETINDQTETIENPGARRTATEQSGSEAAESTGEFEVPPYSWTATSSDRQAIAATNGVEVIVLPVDFPATFRDGVRTIGLQLAPPYRIELQPTNATPTAFDAEVNEDGDAVAAVAFDDGTLQVIEVTVEASFMSSDLTVSSQVRSTAGLAGLEHLVVGAGQDVLYGADGKNLFLWELDEDLGNPVSIAAGEEPITALESLLGSRSVVVAHEDGSLDVWSRLTTGLHRIRELPSTLNPVVELRSSPRDKGFVALEDSGALVLMHATSERVLWRGYVVEPSGDAAPLPVDLFYAPKADGVVALMPSQTVMLEVDNPHPEVSLKTLFGKVWYEGYDRPEYVWQSTGGTDDFEPKLSLVPLLIGTLKGTFYSMLLAVPLAVLAAMYASQFMHPRLLATIKPAIEVMAALPSVVLGFLAGLWLAPRLEQVLPGLILALVVMPPATLLAGWLWTRLPASWRKAQTDGAEVLWFAVFLVITAAACFQLNSVIESSFFAPDFQSWVGTALGLTYDQRNAVVVGLAMGFAVIPIIFAISEDAFSNVPKNLTSGSLALGASRWQTVTRVVLPTASPGIFSAIMIGFGRAIGETMIVLMATGNTPIMDWNPFNGFRTLSANIAVEIPEAPQYGTLYRVLFLSGLVLFVLTFVVNTVAEVVRQRLRRKYSEL